MTTYVLHGGKSSIDTEKNRLFFQQFTSLVPKNEVHILLCYWSREKGEWQKKFDYDKTQIEKQTNKITHIEMVDTPEDLFQKMPRADVMYVCGGEEEYLRPYMSKLAGLKKLLDGKVYIGSSMGAFFPSKHYVLSLSRQKTDTALAGLGFIPYSVLCHWNIEKEKDRKIGLLKKVDQQTEILCLNEEEFKILKI